MKKLLSIALCAAAVSAFADPTETVLGEVGVTAITSSLSNTIVAVSYDDLTGGSGIVVSNFVKTTNLTKGDQLVIFTNGFYEAWTLASNETTHVQYWEAPTAKLTINAQGKLEASEGTPAADIAQSVGTGIWLVRQNPIAANGSTNSFYIYGKPVSDLVSYIPSNTWTLVGNPLQKTTVTIGKEKAADTVIVKNATDGDQIVVPIPPNGNLCYYTYKSTKGWRTTDGDGHWVDNNPPTLGAGLGCWIRTQAACTINW